STKPPPSERHVVDSNAPSARDDSPRDLRDTAPSPARSRVSSEEESRRFRNGGEPRVDHVVYVLVGPVRGARERSRNHPRSSQTSGVTLKAWPFAQTLEPPLPEPGRVSVS